MEIKKFAVVAGIAVSAALIVSACQESPTASDSVGNETAVLGQTFATKPAPKVDVCHRKGNGSFHLINVSGNALAAHIDHGDGQPGDAVPGDPSKEFDGACGQIDVGPPPTTAFASPEASGKTVTLSCDPGTVIAVIQATYGGNCTTSGLSYDPAYPPFPPINFGDTDTSAHLAFVCNGEETCVYSINHTVIGDPFLGCAKDYLAEWACDTPTGGGL